MAITALRWWRYRVPFTQPFVTRHGTVTERDGAIVALETDGGLRGVGEITSRPERQDLALPPEMDSLHSAAPALLGRTPEDAVAQLRAMTLAPGTRCALETALFDLLGRAQGRTLADVLIANFPPDAQDFEWIASDSVPVNAVIGGLGRAATVAAARAAVAAGFRTIKLKVPACATMDDEIARIRAARQAVGPEVRLRLDANEAWLSDTALAILAPLQDCAIEYVEQPLRCHDLKSLSWLRRKLSQVMAIAVDESIGCVADIDRVAIARAAGVVILKPSALGGPRAAMDGYRRACAGGIPTTIVTSVLQSGIGVALDLHVAALVNAPHAAAGLATLDLLADDLIVERLPIVDGAMTVPGPGLGVTPDIAALARFATERGEVRA